MILFFDKETIFHEKMSDLRNLHTFHVLTQMYANVYSQVYVHDQNCVIDKWGHFCTLQKLFVTAMIFSPIESGYVRPIESGQKIRSNLWVEKIAF